MYSEWLAWRVTEMEELGADRREMGLPEDPEEEDKEKAADEEEAKVVEEIVEEIVDETEEILT